MRDELARHTLAELAQRVAPATPPIYHQSMVAWLDNRAASKKQGRGDAGMPLATPGPA